MFNLKFRNQIQQTTPPINNNKINSNNNNNNNKINNNKINIQLYNEPVIKDMAVLLCYSLY
jgi:hypothetical protein